MNLLSRTFAELLSSPSTRQRLIVQPVLILHQSSSLYSTTTTPSWAAHQKNEVSQGKKDEYVPSDEDDWPRPSEIPWQAKVANSVNFIGHVQMPVQFQTSTDGKYWAGTIISQRKASHSPHIQIPIIFEGNLAHIAVCHLKENDYVQIAGQLNADPPLFTNQGQANVQVMVHSINFVNESSQMNKIPSPYKQEERAFNYSASVKNDKVDTLASWRDLVDNPKQWQDYREDKLNGLVKPKHPDFKHKDGRALWVDSAPRWILSGLEGLEFDAPIYKTKQVKEHKGEESWKDLVENPDKWWDNRSGKISEKSPDFKHKDTGEGLWLDSSPAWVLSKLPPVKIKQEAAIGTRDTLLS